MKRYKKFFAVLILLTFLFNTISFESKAEATSTTLPYGLSYAKYCGVYVHIYKADKSFKIELAGNEYEGYSDRVNFIYKKVKKNSKIVAGLNGGLFSYLKENIDRPEVYHLQNGICLMMNQGKMTNLSTPLEGTTDTMFYDNRDNKVKIVTVSTTTKKAIPYYRFMFDAVKHYAWAISGGVHALIFNGVKKSDAYVNATNPDIVRRNMRAIFGVTEDGSYIFVVIPVKVKLPLARDIMSKIGCVNAINLDGSASSSLVVRSAKKKKNGKDDWYIYPRKFAVRDVRTCILLNKP